jgi:hypothetical protein
MRTWKFWVNRLLDIMALLSIAGIALEILVASQQYDDVNFCNPITSRADCQAEVFKTCDWTDIDQLDGNYCDSDARTAIYYFIVGMIGIIAMLFIALLGSRAAPFLIFKQKARWKAVIHIFTVRSFRALLAGFLQFSEGILLLISSAQYERYYYVVCDLYSDADSCEADALEQFCAWNPNDDGEGCVPIIDVPFVAVNIFHYASIVLLSISYLWILALGYSLLFASPVLLLCCCRARRKGRCTQCHPKCEPRFWKLFACSSFSRIYYGLCVNVLHPPADHEMVEAPGSVRIYEVVTGVLVQGSILVATTWMYIKIGFVGEEASWVLIFVLCSSVVGFLKGVIGIFYEEEAEHHTETHELISPSSPSSPEEEEEEEASEA